MSDRRGRVTEPTRVLLIVSGGIAAYKAPEIVRALVKDGKQVQVVTTPAAAAFVTELSLATVSGRPVRTTLLDAAAEGSVGHIELADWPDLVLVAPSTADLMARAAAGMANDLASTILLATRAPVLWAPAMNTNMWRHRATRDVLARLAGWGHRFVGPDAGDLACGWIGEGRMIDPPIIVGIGPRSSTGSQLPRYSASPAVAAMTTSQRRALAAAPSGSAVRPRSRSCADRPPQE